MSAAAAAALQQKIRTIVMTGSVAAVTVAGTWYGATLKSDMNVKEKAAKREEATLAEKIAVLEEHRGALVAKRLGLEKKIKQLEMRAAGATRDESIQGQERRR